MLLLRSALALPIIALLTLCAAGCDNSTSSASSSQSSNSNDSEDGEDGMKSGTMMLTIAGKEYNFVVDEFSAMITDASDEEKSEYPDWVEIEGPEFFLGAVVPYRLSLGEEEGCEGRLHEATIDVLPALPEHAHGKEAFVKVDGVSCRVKEGSFRLDEYAINDGALYRTPLTGTITLTMEGNGITHTAEGKLDMMGNSYY